MGRVRGAGLMRVDHRLSGCYPRHIVPLVRARRDAHRQHARSRAGRRPGREAQGGSATELEPVINLESATALRLTILRSLPLRADRLIR